MLRRSGLYAMRAMALVVVLVACVAAPPPQTSVKVEDDQFDPAVQFTGVPMRQPSPTVTYVEWNLRTFIVKATGEVKYQVGANFRYQEPVAPAMKHYWRHYFVASDDTAHFLKLHLISRFGDQNGTDFSGLAYDKEEDFAIDVSESLLRDRYAQGKGYAIKVRSEDGDEEIFTVAPWQIKMQFEAVDLYLQSHGKSQAGATAAKGGYKQRLGLKAPAMTPEIAQQIGYDKDYGFFVIFLTPGSPAERAGIQVGDVIEACNGKPLDHTTLDQFMQILTKIPDGQPFTLTLWRKDAGEQTVTVSFNR